jgi:hypothetical protein
LLARCVCHKRYSYTLITSQTHQEPLTGVDKSSCRASYSDVAGFSNIGIGIFVDTSGSLNAGDGNDAITGTGQGDLGGETLFGSPGDGGAGTGIFIDTDGNDFLIATSIIDGVQQKVSIGGGLSISLGTGDDYSSFVTLGRGKVEIRMSQENKN